MSDILADISAIYRISGVNETIFDTESRLQEKSRKIDDISAKYRNLTEISVEISTRRRHARGKFFFGFFGRYIADISKISAIYRRYFRYIGEAACGSDLLCRKSDGPDQASFSNG